MRKYEFTFFLIVVCIFSAFYGLERYDNAESVCTNGGCQNYKVIQHFWADQTPYWAFANYRGAGLSSLCAPLVALYSNFSVSLFITFPVTVFVFILFSRLIFYLVTKNALVSALAAPFLSKFVRSFFFT